MLKSTIRNLRLMAHAACGVLLARSGIVQLCAEVGDTLA
jgi:hypothetical protein